VNFEPSVSGTDLCVEWFTDPDPSKVACWPASASKEKIASGDALMTRSTLTVFGSPSS
jgi:catabolite regulation protein CreA